jgi:hypothetical protein
VVPFSCSAEIIQYDAGLDTRNAARRIDFEDARHVLRKVHDDSSVTTLSGE